MASNKEEGKLKGVYLVPDARMLKPNFGPSEHIKVGLEQLRKYFDMELLVLGSYQVESSSSSKPSITSGRATKNGFVGALRDIKLLITSNRGTADLARELLSRQVDFVYERGQYLDYRGLRAARRLGIRHFYEVNWLNFLGIQQFYSSWFNGVAKKFEERAYAATTLNFFVGTQHKLLRVSSSKVCTIQNGIDEALILSNAQHTPPLATTIKMCYVANLMPHHRFDVYLEALKLLKSDCKLELHLIGYNFEKFISSIPSYIEVVNYGPVAKENLPDILRRCNVGVISGGPAYSSFMKLFEYAAFKQCIICPNLENIKLMFDETEIAYFHTDHPASLTDTLNRICANPELVKSLGTNIYNKVSSNYTWERIYEQIAQRINQAVVA